MNITPSPVRNVVGMLATLALLTACGGGGGGGGGESPGPQGNPTVSAASLDTSPLSIITLEVDPAWSDTSWNAEIDLSGTGSFHPGSTMEVPVLRAEQGWQLAAPPLQLLSGTDLVVGDRFSLRLIAQPEGRATNVLTFGQTPVIVPPSARGIPDAVWKLVLKGQLVESENAALVTLGNNIRVGWAQEAREALGLIQTNSLADVEAEGLLRSIYGVSILEVIEGVQLQHALPGEWGAPRRFAVETLSAGGAYGVQADSSAVVEAQNLTDIRGAYSRITQCVGSQINLGTGGRFDDAIAQNCLDLARREIRDGVIPGISNLQRQVGLVGSGLAAITNRGLSRFVGTYSERLLSASERTENTALLAQWVLRTPAAGGSVDELRDFAFDQITSYGKNTLYDHIAGQFSEIEQTALELLGAPDALFGAVPAFGSSGFSALTEVEDRLLGNIQLAKDLAARPDAFGKINGDSAGIEIPLGIGGETLVLDGDLSVSEFCGMFGSMIFPGGLSCERFAAPFYDDDYLVSVLMPIMDRLIDDLLPRLSTCLGPSMMASLRTQCVPPPGGACTINGIGNRPNAGDSPGGSSGPSQCDALLDEVGDLVDRLVAAIEAYDTGSFSCDAGYQAYDTGKGALTCIFRDLLEPFRGQCLAGSRPSPWDIGLAQVCVYYSRDYVRNGQCRPNYERVTFLGAERCRWWTLPLGQPVAYSIDELTGSRVIIER